MFIDLISIQIYGQTAFGTVNTTGVPSPAQGVSYILCVKVFGYCLKNISENEKIIIMNFQVHPETSYKRPLVFSGLTHRTGQMHFS